MALVLEVGRQVAVDLDIIMEWAAHMMLQATSRSNHKTIARSNQFDSLIGSMLK